VLFLRKAFFLSSLFFPLSPFELHSALSPIPFFVWETKKKNKTSTSAFVFFFISQSIMSVLVCNIPRIIIFLCPSLRQEEKAKKS